MKKALSLLLAIVMVVGILPMTAMAAGNEIGKTTNGEFVDLNAEANKSYEYTVTGSDGSEQTVTVYGKGTATGNKVTEQTGSGEVYYQKVDARDAQNGTYLLVYKDGRKNYAVNSSAKGYTVNVSKNNTIEGPKENLEWNYVKNGNTIQLDRNGAYLGITRNADVTTHADENERNFTASFSGEGAQLKHKTGYNNFYLNGNGKTISASENATVFYLYEKVAEPTGTEYTVHTDGLDALLAKSFVESQYTADSWKTYADAKAAAEAAKGKLNNPYTEKTAANAALAKIDNATRDLDTAIKGLTKKTVEPGKPVEPGQCVKPEITWHRTWEPDDNKKENIAGYPKPIRHLDPNDNLNIQWKWDSIKSLTASNPKPWNANNGKSATWTVPSKTDKRGNEEVGPDWQFSNVRRFTGTFIWPEGVGMDGTMTLQSVNDADYQFIYDYIDEKNDDGTYKRTELQERYGNAKVIPINDDMYVFISKVSDGDPTTWDEATAKNHLAFWTGTTGKGIWSHKFFQNGDWGRTEPARFLGTSATPAFHGSWPNLEDRTGGSNNNVVRCDELVTEGENHNYTALPVMKHSDAWYTMTDTNALKSKLNELYGATANLGGQEMRIDIYAFNNSGTGGMDELELILCAAEKTTAEVQVNYWLDSVGATALGSSVMTKNIGETINLPNGTNSTELNHKKAEAIRIAGASADVSNGTQVEKDFVVQKSGNVINVVYTRTIQGVQYYTYDFGVKNQYIYKDENESAIQGVSVECATDTISASFSDHNITLTYTPKDALGSFVQATLVVERRNNTNRYEIGFIPASNVLYEENFITGSWDTKTQGAEITTVNDNDDNVYGHTAAYNKSTGFNGIYTATVSENNKKTATDLKFSFRGLGLDLIGSCGPNYGTLAVKVMQGTSVVKAFIVNTSYAPGVIHQVPLLHTQKGLLAGSQYDVTVRGIYVAPAAAASVMSVDGSSAITPDLYEALIDMGLSDEDMDKVEFVNAADNLPAVSTFSVEPAAAAGDQTVAVDSFRVYRSTEKAAAAYAKNEQNLIYTNVMDEAITGNFYAYVEQATESGQFTAENYEGKGGPENELYLMPGAGISFKLDAGTKSPYAQVSLRAVNGATQANNSIELTHNTEMYYEVKVEKGMITIANTGSDLLAIGNLKTNAKISGFDQATKEQAVRAVAAFFAMPEPEPETNTDFLVIFELDKWGYSWEDGSPRHNAKQFTVTEEDGGILAPAMNPGEDYRLVCWKAVDQDLTLTEREILTVKAMEDCADWSGKERIVIFRPVVEEIEDEEEFEPEHFDIQMTVERGYSAKYVNVNVEASADVAYITVNGQRVDATNADWVEFGFDPYLIFVVDLEMGRNEEVEIEIVAYDANGVASDEFEVEE